MLITRELLRTWNACYSDEQPADLLPLLRECENTAAMLCGILRSGSILGDVAKPLQEAASHHERVIAAIERLESEGR